MKKEKGEGRVKREREGGRELEGRREGRRERGREGGREGGRDEERGGMDRWMKKEVEG